MWAGRSLISTVSPVPLSSCWSWTIPVSYTHLDVYKRQEEIRDTLPVVTQEIGDSWIHGAGSDPKKMSQYRALLRLRKSWTGRARETANRWLIQIPEHTWGLDYKTYLKDYEHFAREEFEAVRSQPAYQKMERSWEEQRGYLTSLTAELSEKERLQAQRAMEEYKREPVDVSLYLSLIHI